MWGWGRGSVISGRQGQECPPAWGLLGGRQWHRALIIRVRGLMSRWEDLGLSKQPLVTLGTQSGPC